MPNLTQKKNRQNPQDQISSATALNPVRLDLDFISRFLLQSIVHNRPLLVENSALDILHEKCFAHCSQDFFFFRKIILFKTLTVSPVVQYTVCTTIII